MLARETVPWGLRLVPRIECENLLVASFAVETVSVAVAHKTLLETLAVGNETEGDVYRLTHRSHWSARGL